MKKLFIHHPLFRLICPPLYGTMIYLLVLLIFDSLGQLADNFFSREVLLCIALTFLLTESLRMVTILLDKYYPAQSNVRVRLVLQVAANGVATLLIISAGVAAYFYFIVGYTTFQTELMTLNSLFLVSSLFYTMVYFSLFYLNQHNQVRLAEETVLRQKMEFQLQALTREVNPPLLYGSLETLITLVHQDAESAESFIEQLSAIYRYQLEQKHQELALLNDELKASEALVYVYNRRHRGNVRLQRPTPAELEENTSRLVPGTLLKLIETAVQSTIITDNQPLELHLSAEAGLVTLSYSWNERLTPSVQASKVVTELSRAYGFFTDRTVEYQSGNKCITITIPLLAVQEPAKPMYPRINLRQSVL